MEMIILSTVLSFLIAFFSIPVIIQVAKSKKLFDEPNERKLHKDITPTLGGLGIFAGFIFGTLLFVSQAEMKELQYFVAAALVIFFLGLKDDILVLSVTKKFIGQIIAACIIIQLGKLQIHNLHGLFGIQELPQPIGFVFTLLIIIFITNSFNLIDGVDGLTGTLGILISIAFGAYFFLIHQQPYAMLSLALSGSLLGFLIYNFPPAKIFMGDTGSMLVGLTHSILIIKFLSIPSAEHLFLEYTAIPAIGFAILSIPVFDSLRVFSIRILNKRSPFSPDRNHIHHFLLDIGCSPISVIIIIVSATIFWTILAILLHQLNPNILFAILLCGQLFFSATIFYIRKNKINGRKDQNIKLQKKGFEKPLANWVMDPVE